MTKHTVLNPRADVTRSLKQEYQWPTERTDVFQKILKKLMFVSCGCKVTPQYRAPYTEHRWEMSPNVLIVKWAQALSAKTVNTEI